MRNVSVSAAKALAFGAALLSLAACAYPTRNYPLDVPLSQAPYRRANFVQPSLKDTLVIVTASGGGSRATALTMSVLQGMANVKLDSGGHLSDEIDVLSSVSGGSVAAADFALYGTGRFDELEDNFLKRDGVGHLAWNILNPVGLASYSTNARERIDALIDYFDATLFHDATMGSLLGGKHPYLVLNAGDMVEGTPFALTQDNFDLLCSDLAKTKISTAVAASAAFPVALSPVTLTNYSPCPMQPQSWPPGWVRLGTDQTGDAWHLNPENATRARVAAAYASGATKRYIHLLDGGIADNLGVIEPWRMLSTREVKPSFLPDIQAGRIKKIVFIVIDARSAPASGLDGSQATPGAVDMLLGTIDAGIDRTAMGNKARLHSLLVDTFNEQAESDSAEAGELRRQADDAAKSGDAAQAAKLRKIADEMDVTAAHWQTVKENTFLVPVDFDAIGPDACRLAYHSIPTSWTLKDAQVDDLLKMGKALLAKELALTDSLNAIKGSFEQQPETVEQVCKAGLPPL